MHGFIFLSLRHKALKLCLVSAFGGWAYSSSSASFTSVHLTCSDSESFFVTSWAYVLKTIFIANNPVKWKDDVFPWKFSSADLLAVL